MPSTDVGTDVGADAGTDAGGAVCARKAGKNVSAEISARMGIAGIERLGISRLLPQFRLGFMRRYLEGLNSWPLITMRPLKRPMGRPFLAGVTSITT